MRNDIRSAPSFTMKAQKSFRTILSKWQKQDKQNQEADDVASMSIVSIAKRPSRQHSSPEQPIKEDQVFDGEQSSSRVTRQSSSSRVLKQVSSRRINRKNSSRRFLGRFLSRKNVSENSATASDEIVTIEEGIEEECAEILSEPFHDYYKLGEELGSGAFAVVHAGRDNRTGKDYAIKIASTENLTDKDLEALHIEMNVMAALQHPHLVKLHEIYKVGTDFYIVMEQMKGGELLDRIVQKEYYNEKEARDACLVLFEAMAYCHEKHIAHRDLKPENLLLTSTDDDSNIKIADFGFAKRCPEDGFRTMCGSPGYIAPEVLTSVNTGPYDWQCDMWSLGVIVYILLGGYAPFEEPNDEALLFEKIKCADYEFHEEYWGPVSTDAKNLISSLLTIDPRKRLTAKQALKHPWLTASDAILETQDLGVNLTELKKFNAKRKFRAAVGTVIATQRLTSLWQKQQ